jgi:hypothetical protein
MDDRGTLSFNGVGTDASSGRLRELRKGGGGGAPATEDMLSVRSGVVSGVSRC